MLVIGATTVANHHDHARAAADARQAALALLGIASGGTHRA
ncbi:hypothetical protein [Dactylosporangium roseum]|nr:hypothetical protein [Dactylosporangium roseum]